jgi:hypothetical protein
MIYEEMSTTPLALDGFVSPPNVSAAGTYIMLLTSQHHGVIVTRATVVTKKPSVTKHGKRQNMINQS